MKWAPSSEFVSSRIPSLQILTAHAQPFRGARDLAFCLKVPLDSLLVWASSEGSGETARMRRLAWTFAARIGDKYQIRLTRSKSALITFWRIAVCPFAIGQNYVLARPLCGNFSLGRKLIKEFWQRIPSILLKYLSFPLYGYCNAHTHASYIVIYKQTKVIYAIHMHIYSYLWLYQV